MSVRVRLFASLREAAGTSETTVSPGSLPAILSELEQRYGELFAKRLAVSSIHVDGRTVARNTVVEVPDEAELTLLPPVSGGSGVGRFAPEAQRQGRDDFSGRPLD